MTDTDSLERLYLSQPSVFADIFNYVIYGGRDVIDKNSLREMDSRLTAIISDDARKQTANRYPDLVKAVAAKEDGRRILLLLNIENQSFVDYGMPARVMLYDALKYSHLIEMAAQNRFGKSGLQYIQSGKDESPFFSKLKKGELIPPVITIVLHFGMTAWDGPTRLYDILDFPDEETKRLVADYPLHLIQPGLLDSGAIGLFRSDFGKVASFLRCARDKDRLAWLVQNDLSYWNMAGLTARFINKLTNSNLPINNQQETASMCKAIDDMRQESKAEGRAEEQAANIAQIIRYQLTKNISHGDLVDTLIGVFHLSADEAEQRIRQVAMA